MVLIWEQDTWLSQLYLYIIEIVRTELEIHFFYIWPVIRTIIHLTWFILQLDDNGTFILKVSNEIVNYSERFMWVYETKCVIYFCLYSAFYRSFLAEGCRAWAFYEVFSSLFLRNMVVYCTHMRLLLWSLLLFSSILPIPLCLRKKTSP